VAPASSARTSPSASRRGIPSTRCANDFDPVCARASTNARTLHPSRARTADLERLVALDRSSSWTSSTIARA
jgi:hypothetical protein